MQSINLCRPLIELCKAWIRALCGQSLVCSLHAQSGDHANGAAAAILVFNKVHLYTQVFAILATAT